jgi:hypothetical protein
LTNPITAFSLTLPGNGDTFPILADYSKPDGGFGKITGLVQGKVYYFKIEEVNVPAAWNLKTEPQIVKVEYVGGEWTAEYPTDGATYAQFDNEYKTPGPIEAIIKGAKTVEGENAPDALFTFNIQLVADENGEPTENDGKVTFPYGKTTTRQGAGDFRFNIALPEENAVYYFKIWETGAGTISGGWMYDAAEYIVRVVVTNDTTEGWIVTSAIISPNGAAEITFKNTYTVGGPKLPETGGIAFPFAIIGSIIMFAAVSAIIFRIKLRSLKCEKRFSDRL